MKSYILLFSCIWFSEEIKAQTSIHPFWGASVNTVQSAKSDDVEMNSVWGYHVGAGIDIPLNKLISIEPILRYNEKGYNYASWFSLFGPSLKDYSYTYKYSTLELPVMVNLNLKLKDIKLVYNVGPYLGYVLRKTEYGDNSGELIYDSNNDKSFNIVANTLDYGIIVGSRLEMRKFTMGVNGAVGMKKIELGSNYKHFNIQVTFGYKFKL